jgi:hypothetical protein
MLRSSAQFAIFAQNTIRTAVKTTPHIGHVKEFFGPRQHPALYFQRVSHGAYPIRSGSSNRDVAERLLLATKQQCFLRFAMRYCRRVLLDDQSQVGDGLRSKTVTAQKSEALCKVLAHNLCCVIQSIYELGIEPTFWEEAA